MANYFVEPLVKFAGFPRPSPTERFTAYRQRCNVGCTCDTVRVAPATTHEEDCPELHAYFLWMLGPEAWDDLHARVRVEGWVGGG